MVFSVNCEDGNICCRIIGRICCFDLLVFKDEDIFLDVIFIYISFLYLYILVWLNLNLILFSVICMILN